MRYFMCPHSLFTRQLFEVDKDIAEWAVYSIYGANGLCMLTIPNRIWCGEYDMYVANSKNAPLIMMRGYNARPVGK